jgi:hypothetical protein
MAWLRILHRLPFRWFWVGEALIAFGIIGVCERNLERDKNAGYLNIEVALKIR